MFAGEHFARRRARHWYRVAKGIASGLPLSATIAKAEIHDPGRKGRSRAPSEGIRSPWRRLWRPSTSWKRN